MCVDLYLNPALIPEPIHLSIPIDVCRAESDTPYLARYLNVGPHRCGVSCYSNLVSGSLAAVGLTYEVWLCYVAAARNGLI